MQPLPELPVPPDSLWNSAHERLMSAFEPSRVYCAWTDAPVRPGVPGKDREGCLPRELSAKGRRAPLGSRAPVPSPGDGAEKARPRTAGARRILRGEAPRVRNADRSSLGHRLSEKSAASREPDSVRRVRALCRCRSSGSAGRTRSAPSETRSAGIRSPSSFPVTG